MGSVIDYNAIAASVYLTVLGLNSVATSLVGLDCIWCRLLPYDNGEDVIVLEYTLHQYDCPKQFKVITTNSDYLIGNYMVDLWGVHSEVPLEINVDIETWKQIYGAGTMPQKGDFVLFSLLHKAFEVKSSTIVYTVGELPTSYKCLLGTWQHNANRKESEEFMTSIDEITDSQDRLFGEAISREVADSVVETETAFVNTTYKDPLKTFDFDSIVMDSLYGEDGTAFVEAYYDFSKASQHVAYVVNGSYNKESKENHWIFSCWFKTNDDADIKSGKVTLSDPFIKEKDYWWFELNSGIKIEEGDEVTIYRGGIIKLMGTIESRDCEPGFLIKVSASDCLKASAKVQLWWKQGNWKILKYNHYNILTGYNGDNVSYKISIDQNNLHLRINDTTKKIVVADGKSLDYSNWHYLTIDMSPSSTRVILIKQIINTVTNKYSKNIIVDKTVKFKVENFEFDQLLVENAGNDICMCCFRLYENEYPIEDTYQINMYSNVTRNASKCIFVDGPEPDNAMTFVTPIK